MEVSDRVTALAGLWARRLAGVTFVPDGRARTREMLANVLSRLVTALTTEPFDAGVGYQVGRDLVAGHVSSPQALGRTIDLLSGRLLADLAIDHPRAVDRLSDLLGELATGYTESLRDVVLAAAEEINQAERVAWRDQQHALHRRIQHALLHDPLTDLPNRAHLVRWLQDVLDGAAAGDRIGLCVIDLDRFTTIEDSLGGDRACQVLRLVANLLCRQANPYGHFLAHLGGDVFAIAVERTAEADAMVKAADRALRTLRDPVELNGHQIRLSASAGIVERPTAGTTAVDLVAAAHVSLKWAKRDQGGRWASFDHARHAHEARRHAITAAMPAALAGGEFTLAYQPLIRLADDALVGVEALARWRHPAFGPISPVQFISSAEDTGLIVPLGRALLEQACRQAVQWRQATGTSLVISVNLAVAQIRDPGAVHTILDVLAETGWPAELLQLEITESAIVSSDDESVDSPRALARCGVTLAIDDFGTGYSSLAYLAELPVHGVKLAARFLHGLDTATSTRRSNRTILPALITLSHQLGLSVTAEGIELPEQADHLRRLGCDLAQGYHFGRPADPDHITPLLTASGRPNRRYRC